MLLIDSVSVLYMGVNKMYKHRDRALTSTSNLTPHNDVAIGADPHVTLPFARHKSLYAPCRRPVNVKVEIQLNYSQVL